MVSVTISTGVSMLPRSSINRRDVVRMTGIFSVSSLCSRTSRNFDVGIITITVSPFGRNGRLLELKIGLVGVRFLAGGEFYVNTRLFRWRDRSYQPRVSPSFKIQTLAGS